LQDENLIKMANRLNKSPNEMVDIIVDEVKKVIGNIETPINSNSGLPLIPLGVSNRHIHLTEKTFAKLFGNGTEFEELRPLYQPGEFASKQVLTIVGSKQRAIPAVRILGPLRNYDQVEISYTDSIYLGVDPPVINSGTLDQAAPLTLVGPAGSIYLEKCAIIASRHIHMTSSDAVKFGVSNGDYCKVKIDGIKSTIFENVLIRINDNTKLQIHLDTDDANAALVKKAINVELLGKCNQ